MTVTDSLANGTRAAHDVGLAAWLGGAMFGKFAHNPSLANIASHTERGSVSNAAWNGYNAINAAGLGAAAIGWTAARLTETRPTNLSATERALSSAKDGLMAAAVLTGVASGVQGARLARQAPDGAVPVETGTKPARRRPRRPRASSAASASWAGQHRRGRGAGRRQRRPRTGQSQPPGQEARAGALEQPAVDRHGRHHGRGGSRSGPSPSRLSCRSSYDAEADSMTVGSRRALTAQRRSGGAGPAA